MLNANAFRDYVKPEKFRGFTSKFNKIFEAHSVGNPSKTEQLEKEEGELISSIRKHMDVSRAELIDDNRRHYVVVARHVFLYGMRNSTPKSLVSIGRTINCHYSTVIYSLNSFESRYASDRSFATLALLVYSETSFFQNILERLREIKVFYSKRADTDECIQALVYTKPIKDIQSYVTKKAYVRDVKGDIVPFVNCPCCGEQMKMSLKKTYWCDNVVCTNKLED